MWKKIRNLDNSVNEHNSFNFLNWLWFWFQLAFQMSELFGRSWRHQELNVQCSDETELSGTERTGQNFNTPWWARNSILYSLRNIYYTFKPRSCSTCVCLSLRFPWGTDTWDGNEKEKTWIKQSCNYIYEAVWVGIICWGIFATARPLSLTVLIESLSLIT